ncbi:MAG TPA: hypothetical protein VFQ60_03200, partial [Patescibacteria group bacterium]|nr:hypothetical protein [Patescibacteria group bacterium]
GKFSLTGFWDKNIPFDAYHLLYGAVRREWLKKKAYSAHAACLLNEKGEGILLVGHSGVGKTSIALQLILKCGWKLFSGNKTLLSFQKGKITAVAGTKTMTIREMDKLKYKTLVAKGFSYGDRFAFSLPEEAYAQAAEIEILKIILVRLNDGAKEDRELSSLSALHTLYPYLFDSVNADTLLAGGSYVLSGEPPKGGREFLARSLAKSLNRFNVHSIVGSMDVFIKHLSRV